ncbi:D-arabinitol dehydrogenase 1 [Sphaceloma murrayae]|uniref:D-arabinitol dehydrogenase 1 n=1 Tax=Sphaceloma murrayae TaxID=2082308 RepID=A0A2K1R2M7_9PEZI|nr:D-arabinitol dehydrogenase 1 [Sphaceloma murrayae]
MALEHIIIVGAGPAGLVMALMLGKQGVNVTILEAADALDKNPRASHYSAPVVYELKRAGVLDDIKKIGFVPSGVAWRKPDGTKLAALEMKDVPEDEKMVCLPLDRMTKIVYDHLVKQSTVKVLWNHKVTSKLDQDDKKARVVVQTPEGEKTFEADYIIGTDGANSQIRRALFGDMNFPGFTWDEQVVATNVYYDMSPYNWGDSSFIIDKEHWVMVAKITNDGMYRISYGEKPGLSYDQLKERQPWKFKTFLPGNPDPDKYKIVNFSPYKVHQRCAESLRKGRFLLAADSAHLCNPFGGMGLTGGLVDAGNLYDCLIGLHKGLVDDSILDKYSDVRRKVYHEVIDPISSGNIRRMWQDPETVMETDEFLQMCVKVENDPEASKAMQQGMKIVMHDFTQYYKNNASAVPDEPEKFNGVAPAPLVAASNA